MKTVQIGQKVQITFKNQKGDKIEILCDIKDFGDESLILNYPEHFMEFANFLDEGSEIVARIYAGPHIKVLHSIVITAPQDNEIEIEFPEDYETIQRRAYIRENLALNIVITTTEKSFEAVTIDIGGGGLKLNSAENLDSDSFVSLSIDMNDNKPVVKCIGKVGIKPHFNPDEYLVEFIEISENDRNRVIQKCIQYQTQKLKEQKDQENKREQPMTQEPEVDADAAEKLDDTDQESQ